MIGVVFMICNDSFLLCWVKFLEYLMVIQIFASLFESHFVESLHLDRVVPIKAVTSQQLTINLTFSLEGPCSESDVMEAAIGHHSRENV